MNPLIWAARFGPYVLISGLVVGLALPSLAAAFRPWIQELVVVLLFVSVLRMDPRAVFGSLGDLPRVLVTVLVLQLALPLVVLGLGALTGLGGSAHVLALVLMMAAPSIVGSPNICMMMGAGPEQAMRLMVVGTAVLPITVLPVFWAMPELGAFEAVLRAALRLFLVIAATVAVAVLVRRWLFAAPSPHVQRQMEGASAIALAVFVIGLMEAVSVGARTDPVTTLIWLVFALAANFGAQICAWRPGRRRLPHDRAVALSVIAGNRNISLFFVSLPPEIIAPVLVFIGCYQIPMYLTPLVMRRVYRQERIGA